MARVISESKLYKCPVHLGYLQLVEHIGFRGHTFSYYKCEHCDYCKPNKWGENNGKGFASKSTGSIGKSKESKGSIGTSAKDTGTQKG